MIVGHFPAGYLAACALEGGFDTCRVIWWGIIIGAVLPDVDLLWFAFVDGGSVHHHTYLTHDPALWMTVLSLGLLFGRPRFVVGLGIGALLHMGLDTIAGAITWGWGNYSFSGPLVVVPATQNHWVLSFLVHWTFVVELIVCAIALIVFLLRRRTRASQPS